MLRQFICLLGFIVLTACSTPTSTPDTPPPKPEPVQENTAPSVTLSASQLNGEASFEVTFDVTASDPDGDTLSYRWTRDGQKVEGSTPNLTLTFTQAGSFEIAVRVSDGEHTVTRSLEVSATDDYRPEDAPDVVLIGFAGRCFSSCLLDPSPSNNRAYLGDLNGAATIQALQATFEALGYSSLGLHFRANLSDHSSYGFGYQEASALLDAIHEQWIGDFVNPTRVVLIAHSHGNQFMSLLAFDHPEVRFDYAIYLDAVCWRWDSDHLGAFASTYGTPSNYPRPLNILEAACDSLPVPGVGYQDISDVVPDNVTFALEVQSNGLIGFPLVLDDDDNHRLDGSAGAEVGLAGISRHANTEGHNQVHHWDSKSLAWVMDTIVLNDLPRYELATQAGSSLMVPRAPEGYDAVYE